MSKSHAYLWQLWSSKTLTFSKGMNTSSFSTEHFPYKERAFCSFLLPIWTLYAERSQWRAGPGTQTPSFQPTQLAKKPCKRLSDPSTLWRSQKATFRLSTTGKRQAQPSQVAEEEEGSVETPRSTSAPRCPAKLSPCQQMAPDHGDPSNPRCSSWDDQLILVSFGSASKEDNGGSSTPGYQARRMELGHQMFLFRWSHHIPVWGNNPLGLTSLWPSTAVLEQGLYFKLLLAWSVPTRSPQYQLLNKSLEHTFKGVSFTATDLRDFLLRRYAWPDTSSSQSRDSSAQGQTRFSPLQHWLSSR